MENFKSIRKVTKRLLRIEKRNMVLKSVELQRFGKIKTTDL